MLLQLELFRRFFYRSLRIPSIIRLILIRILIVNPSLLLVFSPLPKFTYLGTKILLSEVKKHHILVCFLVNTEFWLVAKLTIEYLELIQSLQALLNTYFRINSISLILYSKGNNFIPLMKISSKKDS